MINAKRRTKDCKLRYDPESGFATSLLSVSHLIGEVFYRIIVKVINMANHIALKQFDAL